MLGVSKRSLILQAILCLDLLIVPSFGSTTFPFECNSATEPPLSGSHKLQERAVLREAAPRQEFSWLESKILECAVAAGAKCRPRADPSPIPACLHPARACEPWSLPLRAEGGTPRGRHRGRGHRGTRGGTGASPGVRVREGCPARAQPARLAMRRDATRSWAARIPRSPRQGSTGRSRGPDGATPPAAATAQRLPPPQSKSQPQPRPQRQREG